MNAAKVMLGDQVIFFLVHLTAGDVADVMRGSFGVRLGGVVNLKGHGLALGYNLVAGGIYRFVDSIPASK